MSIAEQSPLQKDFEFFLKNLPSFVKEHEGKWLVIHEQSVFGVFNSELEALEVASRKLSLGSFIIQLCSSDQDSYTRTFHSRVLP